MELETGRKEGEIFNVLIQSPNAYHGQSQELYRVLSHGKLGPKAELWHTAFPGGIIREQNWTESK